MNARVATVLTGSIILLLGLAALFYPERAMGVLGFAIPATERGNSVLGEVRATYGGIFVVMGVYTLLATADPWAHRARLLFIGLMWLGACAGRLLGVYLDGNPGIFGWLGVVFELAIGGTLVAASQAHAPEEALVARVPAPPIEAQ